MESPRGMIFTPPLDSAEASPMVAAVPTAATAAVSATAMSHRLRRRITYLLAIRVDVSANRACDEIARMFRHIQDVHCKGGRNSGGHQLTPGGLPDEAPECTGGSAEGRPDGH